MLDRRQERRRLPHPRTASPLPERAFEEERRRLQRLDQAVQQGAAASGVEHHAAVVEDDRSLRGERRKLFQ